MQPIEKIAVIGAGTMGHGIAESFAMHGYSVSVYEPIQEIRDKALEKILKDLSTLAEFNIIDDVAIDGAIEKINLVDDLHKAVKDADFIIEAVPEDIAIKQQLFKELNEAAKPEAILASNTSSLDLHEMILHVDESRKPYCLICHWYNPAHIVPLVELSSFGNMDDIVLASIEELFSKINKKTIRVLKNIPGLIANRIQQGVAREVFSLIEMGAASPSDVEAALKYGPAFRYATTGQLEIADFGGLDIWCTVGDNLLPAMNNDQKSNSLLRRKVEKNQLGLKSGEGFFKYSGEHAKDAIEGFHRKLILQLKTSRMMSEGE